MEKPSNTEERLIDSAAELIYSRSYNAVGVNELCEHAGVKKGSFYHFFPSKRDLTLAALDRISESYARDVWEPAFEKDAPPLKRIERLFELAADYHFSLAEATGQMRGCHFGNLAGEMSTQDEIIRQKIKGIFEVSAGYFESALSEAVASGDLPAETDPRISAQALIAYLEGVLLLAKTNNDPALVRRLAQGATRLAKPHEEG